MPNPFTEVMPPEQRRQEIASMAFGIPKEAWNDQIANTYTGDIRAESHSNPMSNLVELTTVALQEQHITVTDLDLDHIGEKWSTRSESFNQGFSAFRSALRTGNRFDKSRAEHLFDGLDKSQFPELLMTCGANRIMERCPGADYNVVLDLAGTMNVGCTDERMRTPLMIDDIDYASCDPPDAPRNMVGINSPVWSRIGKRCLRRVGLAIKENTRCNNIMSLIEDVWNRESRRPFDKGEARRLISYMLGGCCDVTCGRDSDVYLNNCKFNKYYLAGEGPWENKICLNTDLDNCGAEALICQWEQYLDEMATDPFNGDLIDCCNGAWNVITFGTGCSTKKIQRGLGAHTVMHTNECTEGITCSERRTYQEASRPRFGEVIHHPYISQMAKDHFTTCYGSGTTMNYSDAQIQQMVDRTYLIGCTREVFKRTIEKDFTRSTYGGTNTWAFFNQGVEKFHGVDVSTGLFTEVLKLPGVLLVQGMPDGEDCANLACA